jgi:hypothetical protein
MGSPNGSNDTTHTPPPLSFYNTFKGVIFDEPVHQFMSTCFALVKLFNL